MYDTCQSVCVDRVLQLHGEEREEEAEIGNIFFMEISNLKSDLFIFVNTNIFVRIPHYLLP